MDAPQLQVGFIGLGRQGAPIVQHLLNGGLPVRLWARRIEVLAPFVEAGAQPAVSPADLATGCDVVGVCVWGDTDVVEVVSGPSGLLAGARPGTIIAIHSTTRPETCVGLASAAAERGVTVIDAPVSGGPERSAAGTLLVMVGGEPEALDRCRPAFDTFAETIVHLGAVGTAQTAKLLNNTLLAANLGLAASTLELAARLGISPAAMLQVVVAGSGTSFGARSLSAARVDPHSADVARSYLDKDVRLLSELAGHLGSNQVVEMAFAGVDELAAHGGGPDEMTETSRSI